MELAREEGTFIPTAEQHDLLRACLLDDRDEVAAAFARWKESVVFDEIRLGTLRMIPLLYRNLSRHGIHDELMPRLRGIYRQVWFRNQLILREGLELAAAFRAAGIPLLLIKGAALVRTVYDDVALRPMEDFDMVVPRDRFPQALRIASERGWRIPGAPTDPEAHYEFHHAVALENGSAGEIDLHWCSLYGVFDRSGEQAFWDRSVELRESGIRVLSPPDQLLQLCAHATQKSHDVAPIRWVADALFILRRSADGFDWDRLVAMARARGLSLTMLRCLSYLRDGFGVEVPRRVRDLLAHDVTPGERWLLRMRMADRRMQRWYAALVWLRLLFLDGLRAVPARVALFRRYLRSSFRVPAEVSLPRFIAAKIASPPVAPEEANRQTTAP